jgi:hypothetical protein
VTNFLKIESQCAIFLSSIPGFSLKGLLWKDSATPAGNLDKKALSFK